MRRAPFAPYKGNRSEESDRLEELIKEKSVFCTHERMKDAFFISEGKVKKKMQDYYYGMEGEQFAFFRIPKVLFQDERYKSISAEARILYGLLLDRVTLSLQKGWKDREGRIYIFYTVNEVMESLSCGNKKAIQLMNELENRAGLIERKRQGQGKPSMIYVKNFIRTVDNSDSRHFQKCEDDTSEDVI